MRRALLLLLLLAPASEARADAASRYAEASSLYEAKDFAAAKGAFAALLQEDGPHPDVLLGFGNSAYRLGDYVGATYAYEWGLRLAPGDPSLRQNLTVARTHLVSDVFPSAQSETALRAQEALARIPGRLTLLAALVLWTLGFLLLAARQRGFLEGWTWLGVALLLLSLPGFGHAAWQRQRLAGRTEGILQSTEVAVRSGPGPEYQQLFELHAGTVVRVLDERSGWRRVALPNAAEGWVEADDLAVFGQVETLSPGR